MSYEVVRIEDVCDVRDGTHDSPKYVVEGFPLVTSKNITDGKLNLDNVNLISKEDYDSINKRSGVNIGDIIMPMIGTIGNPHLIVEKPMFAIKNVALFKPKENLINNRYLYKILLSSTFKAQLESESRGGTQKFVSLKILRNLLIPLPPIDIQKKIADTLDKAQELIDKRKEQISALDKFLENLFLDMFGDPVSNPMGWEVKELKEITTIFGGYAFKSSLFIEKGVPVIKIGTVNKGYFDLNNISYYSENEISNLIKYTVYPNDLLISLTGTAGKDDYGNICRATSDFNRYFLNQRVAKLVFNKEFLDDTFAEYIFKNKQFKNEIIKISRGIRQANISNDDILSQKALLPPLDLQNQFASIVEKVEAEKTKLEASLTEMEDNFNSIMQRAFKGELF